MAPSVHLETATVDGSTSLMISMSEPGTTFACSLDGAPFAPCTPPVAYIALTAGIHVFDVRAVDASGATEPTSAVFGLIVVPPLPPPGTDPL